MCCNNFDLVPLVAVTCHTAAVVAALPTPQCFQLVRSLFDLKEGVYVCFTPLCVDGSFSLQYTPPSSMMRPLGATWLTCVRIKARIVLACDDGEEDQPTISSVCQFPSLDRFLALRCSLECMRAWLWLCVSSGFASLTSKRACKGKGHHCVQQASVYLCL